MNPFQPPAVRARFGDPVTGVVAALPWYADALLVAGLVGLTAYFVADDPVFGAAKRIFKKRVNRVAQETP